MATSNDDIWQALRETQRGEVTISLDVDEACLLAKWLSLGPEMTYTDEEVAVAQGIHDKLYGALVGKAGT